MLDDLKESLRNAVNAPELNKYKITTSSLGPVESTTRQSIVVKREKFKETLRDIEATLRVQYWTGKVTNKAAYSKDTIKKLEILRSKLYRAKMDLGMHANSALEYAFLIDFIYNANKIEGSRLPKGEVKRLLEDTKT